MNPVETSNMAAANPAEAPAPAPPTTPPEPQSAEAPPPPAGPSRWRSRLRGMGACGISTGLHAIGLMILSLCIIAVEQRSEPPMIVSNPIDTPKDEELEEIELDPDLQPSPNQTAMTSSSAPMAGVAGALAGGMKAAALDAKVVQKFAKLDSNMSIDHPLDGAPTTRKLIEEVPVGFKGEPRMIIDDYKQAFDVITQEIRWMLDRSDVLVIWCFDQSGSMKDDQQEVRDRVQKVYHRVRLGPTGPTTRTSIC